MLKATEWEWVVLRLRRRMHAISLAVALSLALSLDKNQRREIKWRYRWWISSPDLVSKDAIHSRSGVKLIPKHISIWILANKRFVIFITSHCLFLGLPLPTSHLRIKRPCTTASRPCLHKSYTQYQTCSMSLIVFFIISNNILYQINKNIHVCSQLAFYVPYDWSFSITDRRRL